MDKSSMTDDDAIRASVPREPTQEMLDAAYDALSNIENEDENAETMMRRVWFAFHAAQGAPARDDERSMDGGAAMRLSGGPEGNPPTEPPASDKDAIEPAPSTTSPASESREEVCDPKIDTSYTGQIATLRKRVAYLERILAEVVVFADDHPAGDIARGALLWEKP